MKKLIYIFIILIIFIVALFTVYQNIETKKLEVNERLNKILKGRVC